MKESWAFVFFQELMELLADLEIRPTAREIFKMLREGDARELSLPSQQHFEQMLARKVATLLDEALSWQRGHGQRTATLANVIGSVAGLSHESLHHLTLAALLHDIGLLAFSPGMACHFDHFDLQSYVTLQSHPRIGGHMLEPFRFLRRASVIIAHHHERWDGSGYPYGIRGNFIPIEARVLAIADAFDAMNVSGVTDRHQRALVASRILAVAAGTQFDPHLVAIFRPSLERPHSVFPFD